MAHEADPNADGADAVAIPADEERLLARVLASLAARRASAGGASASRRGYADEMVALRDEIGEARLEDVPALVAQMERVQGVSATRGDLQTFLVDPASPYFGHLRLRERIPGRGTVERDVLIGRATFVDAGARVNVVDWRHAPVSQLFYRYGEGSDYEERFGDRDVEGDVVARRTLTIENGVLLRVACPQGVWAREDARAPWRRTDLRTHALAGGQDTAVRPARGVLGAAPAGRQALDRHLPEISALIDPHQFDVITARGAGVVVIQGGAGSGKTTVGLHRLAYLAYNQPADFPARRLSVVTQGVALAAYISQVLPALGVGSVRAGTFGNLAARALRAEIPWLRVAVVDEAPPAVTRVKSHPALLHELERLAKSYAGKRVSRAAVELWADLLTDRGRLLALLRDAAEMPVPERDVIDAHEIMTDRVAAVMARDPREGAVAPPTKKEARRARKQAAVADRAAARAAPSPEMHWTAMGLEQKPGQRTVDSDLPEHVRRVEDTSEDDGEDDQNIRGATGIDGLPTEDDLPILDADDVAILLRASQLLRGTKHTFAHLFVDEAQDLSPMKLSVLIGRTSGARTETKTGKAGRSVPSITLAGDTSQRLFLDNGFGDWRGVLGHLGLAHVAVEPLRIAYRSTREIMTIARAAMGPLADPEAPEAPRHGAPVEAFRFPGVGAAVAFLAEALRDLAAREPRATVALLARYPEQADRYHEGLRRAEVPALRRVRAQEFAFRPGVEVTDVRQVKGLEFDYVVMLDANAPSYGRDDESRHLFHIGVTRAAYQLWVVVTGTPSPLLADAGLQGAAGDG